MQYINPLKKYCENNASPVAHKVYVVVSVLIFMYCFTYDVWLHVNV